MKKIITLSIITSAFSKHNTAEKQYKNYAVNTRGRKMLHKRKLLVMVMTNLKYKKILTIRI